MRQYAGSERQKDRMNDTVLLDHGQMGLSVAFDLPTQIGYDSDDQWLTVSWKSRCSNRYTCYMEILFDKIPLARCLPHDN